MRIGVDNISLVVRSWPSKQEYGRFMERSDSALNLDVQIQQEKAFYSLTMQSEPERRTMDSWFSQRRPRDAAGSNRFPHDPDARDWGQY